MRTSVSIFIFVVFLVGCGDNTSTRIKESLSHHYNRGLKSLLLDSITYTLADSTVYYSHLLHLLDQRSESFAKMARLRTKLAKADLDSFLAAGGKANHQQERDKLELDKSLENLKSNERQWDIVNDSMDLLLDAIHTTDTSKKVFYKVNYVLKENMEDEKWLLRKSNAILNSDDLKVVFVINYEL